MYLVICFEREYRSEVKDENHEVASVLAWHLPGVHTKRCKVSLGLEQHYPIPSRGWSW